LKKYINAFLIDFGIEKEEHSALATEYIFYEIDFLILI